MIAKLEYIIVYYFRRVFCWCHCPRVVGYGRHAVCGGYFMRPPKELFDMIEREESREA
jgi:hypothetical protein